MASSTDQELQDTRESAERPPYLDEDATGILAVARDLYDDPQAVILPDGRTVGYAETGDPDGTPVITLHGALTGRLGAAIYDEVARELGVRIIAPERPSVGISDPHPDRTLADWAADVVAVMDALDIDRAPIAGISAGGPYALACGALYPDRFPRVAVSGTLGPMSSMDLKTKLMPLIARYVPSLLTRFLRKDVRGAQYDPEGTIEDRVKRSTPADEPIWRGEVGRFMMAMEAAACQQYGPESTIKDVQLFARDWGFPLDAITVPVGIWHGENDRINPIGMARYLADVIPTAELHVDPTYGHVGTIVATDKAMFEWLVH